ncbi:HalOD1 output domain-containing protein [Haloarcula litorea]|uniref:HalOD1 output domain-containing protein n=1 Tax=Haloarcula litorea TaxID=3032579 RepID=UPI0023E82574|nr:HalOD1 output domain-containing protein [Halomicroarcula sp. GDY20]
MTRSERHTRAGDDGTLVAQRHHDPTDAELTVDIVSAVADAEGVAPRELEDPLYEAVDAAALAETFFSGGVADLPTEGVGTVEFRYVGYLVTVGSDGWIRVYDPSS